MYTPVNPVLLYKSGVYRGENYISMFSWCERDYVLSLSDESHANVIEAFWTHFALRIYLWYDYNVNLFIHIYFIIHFLSSARFSLNLIVTYQLIPHICNVSLLCIDM